MILSNTIIYMPISTFAAYQHEKERVKKNQWIKGIKSSQLNVSYVSGCKLRNDKKMRTKRMARNIQCMKNIENIATPNSSISVSPELIKPSTQDKIITDSGQTAETMLATFQRVRTPLLGKGTFQDDNALAAIRSAA